MIASLPACQPLAGHGAHHLPGRVGMEDRANRLEVTVAQRGEEAPHDIATTLLGLVHRGSRTITGVSVDRPAAYASSLGSTATQRCHSRSRSSPPNGVRAPGAAPRARIG